MIEAPTNEQKHNAIIVHGAQMLAKGRSVCRVIDQLRKRGMSDADIEQYWPMIQKQASELIRERRGRIRTMGLCWLFLGLSMLIGIAWSMVMYGALPLILLVGLIPLSYGIYLLQLPPTEEPSIEAPRFIGRGL